MSNLPKKCAAATVFLLFVGGSRGFTVHKQVKKAAIEPITQTQVNSDSCDENKKTDRELNETYSQILKDPAYSENSHFVAAFREAQRAWQKLRDATVEARFPGEDKQGEWGSVYPMCACGVLAELNRKRILELRAWAKGVEEGDVCAGSIKAH